MKKFTILILIGVFTLFFSGKPAAKNDCGPWITINNWGSSYFGDIRVYVTNYTWGNTTTYNNPTFPFTHYDVSGGHFGIIYAFSDVYNGSISFSDPYEVINFNNEGYAAISFDAYCGPYSVDLYP